MDPRDGASRQIDRRAVHRAGRLVRSRVGDRRRLQTALPLPPGDVNNRPTANVDVYIALADGECADVAKFSMSRIWD